MKKVLSIVLALALCVGACFVFASCDKDDVETPEADAAKYKIGIVQLVEHVALDAATEGFKQAIIDELGEDAVEFDFQNGQNDANTCSTIANQFVSNGVDLIMANATPSLQSACNATSYIPILGTSVTEYGVVISSSTFWAYFITGAVLEKSGVPLLEIKVFASLTLLLIFSLTKIQSLNLLKSLFKQ